jgi:predicted AAA+ superfamily ATPase
MLIDRYLTDQVKEDLKAKMVFISGPRQCGKTTLAQSLAKEFGLSHDEMLKHYFNWDVSADREIILKELFPVLQGYLIYDEIHKYKNWRQYLKGLYDKYGAQLNILVTGSARLDYYRKGGDSLQGRYHFLRLHPLSLAELGSQKPNDLKDLLTYGGFPEPFLTASETETRRWSREYRSRLINTEVTGLENIHEISLLEKMSLRLPELVGSPLSINGLREDLNISHPTAGRWLDILERLYTIFRIYPFGGVKIRAVKKEAKHYHYDWTQVENPATRFENLVACHLFKWCNFMEDTQGVDVELRYFRDTDKREVDFVIVKEGQPHWFVECKTSDVSVSRSLLYLKRKYPKVKAYQLCLEKDINVRHKEGITICNAVHFLKDLV